MIYWFDTLTSTFVEAAKEQYGEWDVVAARFQTAGRGQRNHSWSSEQGKNLMFCVVLKPTHVAPRNQFVLSQISALAVVATLAEYNISARIKWTNDIYVGDKKICGMLFENNISEGSIRRSVIGIGVNVNQLRFPDNLPNPTSMQAETGTEFSVDEVLDKLIANLKRYYATDPQMINDEYNSLLYRLNERHQYIIDNTRRESIIRAVEPTGELTVEIEGEIKKFIYGEINFVI